MASRWTLLVVLLIAGTAAARTLKPGDFAYGAELTVNGDNALVVEAIALPADGTSAATDDDLATLRRVGCEFDFNGMKLGCD